MNCREVRRWLSPYLDSELGKTKTFEVSEHLRQCESCATRFEQERRIDASIAEKLSDAPVLDFGAMLREAARPKRSLLGPWRMGAMGLAACLALFAWFAIGPPAASASSAEDWIASEFVSAAPDAKAFVPVSDGSVDVVGQVKSTLGVSLSMKSLAEAFPGHVVDLVSVSERVGDGGAPYVEVRLNCCGEPVLLAFIARDEMGPLGSIPEGDSLGAVHRHASSGLNVVLWTTDRLVLVAASRHSVNNVVPAFSLGAV